MPGPEQLDPPSVPLEALVLPEAMDLSFEGWQPEAFALLERLREEPHIGQYRIERDSGRLDTFLKAPFKRYRDDLVVNWVLPNRLAFETEKNVFSRLLKNDFGAGGCHHHKWMAFYRRSYRRLTDAQLSHSIRPDGLDVGLYVGSYGEDVLAQALGRIEAAPDGFLATLNALLERSGWRFGMHQGAGKNEPRVEWDTPLDALPDDLGRADGFWVRRRFPREAVSEAGAGFVRHALDAVLNVWPVYRFCLQRRA